MKVHMGVNPIFRSVVEQHEHNRKNVQTFARVYMQVSSFLQGIKMEKIIYRWEERFMQK